VRVARRRLPINALQEDGMTPHQVHNLGHVAVHQALMFARGFGAEESKAAFIRARELAAAIEDATERFTIYRGLWLGNMLRGELGLAREVAETFLREAEREALMPR
jgi:hypothetical protein